MTWKMSFVQQWKQIGIEMMGTFMDFQRFGLASSENGSFLYIGQGLTRTWESTEIECVGDW